MSTIEVVVLSLIQGLTEFLPISSSAHLILPSQLLGWDDQGLAFDVAVHFGSLFAVMAYFRTEILSMLKSWIAWFGGKRDAEATLAWFIIFATLPAVFFGFFGKDLIEMYLRSAWVIACTTIVFGLLLWWADKRGVRRLGEYDISWKQAMAIGFAQALAIIPGTSRSGITMTAALMLGMKREAAARFSFLLSIPVILGACVLLTKDIVDTNVATPDWSALAMGIVLTFFSAYACIHYFIKWISKLSMTPFVIYRVLLGIGLVVMLTTG